MLSHVELLRSTALQCLDAEKSPEKQLENLLLKFLEIYETAGARHRILVNDLQQLTPDQKTKIVTIENDITQVFKSLTNKVSNTNNQEQHFSTARTFLLLSMINWTHTWFRPDGKMTSEELGALVFDIFMNGVAHSGQTNNR
jgi:hypothetical protein